MKPRKDFLYGYLPDGGSFHRLGRHWVNEDGTLPRFAATFKCAPDVVVDAIYSRLEDDFARWCPSCRAMPGPGRRVYVAELADGRIKIGSTIHLSRRMYQLDGQVIESLAGSYWNETQVLHRVQAKPVDGTREYFAAEDRDACLAALRTLLDPPKRRAAA